MTPYKSIMDMINIDAHAGAICSIALGRAKKPVRKKLDAAVQQCQKELAEYFTGKRRRFSIRLEPQGTPFQRRVWQELRKVPYGSRVSYGELAHRIGKPRAVRAVASAVARNPIGIIIPCHRAVPAHGRSIGKFGWGVKNKERLLTLEKAL